MIGRDGSDYRELSFDEDDSFEHQHDQWAYKHSAWDTDSSMSGRVPRVQENVNECIRFVGDE